MVREKNILTGAGQGVELACFMVKTLERAGAVDIATCFC